MFTMASTWYYSPKPRSGKGGGGGGESVGWSGGEGRGCRRNWGVQREARESWCEGRAGEQKIIRRKTYEAQKARKTASPDYFRGDEILQNGVQSVQEGGLQRKPNGFPAVEKNLK